MNSTNRTITLNNNIVVKLGGSSHKIFTNGVYFSLGEKAAITEFCDGKITGFVKDKDAKKLFKVDGSFREQNSGKRYKDGFTDILTRRMANLT